MNPTPPKDGMTLRDYFVAHAPAEPQPWFTPAMPLHPTGPTWEGEPRTKEQCETLNDFDEGLIDVEDISDEQTRAFASALKAYCAEQAEWDRAYAKQRYIQWPAAWADEMLKARDLK